jgi:hypothetical protein
MKRTILLLFFCGICTAALAQTVGGGNKNGSSNTNNSKKTTTNENPTNTSNPMKDWDWKDYNVKFQVPADFKITKSDGSTFVATNEKINLSIYPKKGENLTAKKMESSLLAWAKQNNVTNYDKANYIANLKGYQCSYIDGKVGEYPTSLLLLVNPNNPDISLYIWLSYATAEYDTAVAILKSFKPFE